jgi:hypothetical protein
VFPSFQPALALVALAGIALPLSPSDDAFTGGAPRRMPGGTGLQGNFSAFQNVCCFMRPSYYNFFQKSITVSRAHGPHSRLPALLPELFRRSGSARLYTLWAYIFPLSRIFISK